MTPITGEMKVADVVGRHPDTADVFLSYGCPDMRQGLFKVMSRLMTVRNAARIHRLPIDRLLADLNAAMREQRTGETAPVADAVLRRTYRDASPS